MLRGRQVENGRTQYAHGIGQHLPDGLGGIGPRENALRAAPCPCCLVGSVPSETKCRPRRAGSRTRARAPWGGLRATCGLGTGLLVRARALYRCAGRPGGAGASCGALCSLLAAWRGYKLASGRGRGWSGSAPMPPEARTGREEPAGGPYDRSVPLWPILPRLHTPKPLPASAAPWAQKGGIVAGGSGLTRGCGAENGLHSSLLVPGGDLLRAARHQLAL